MRQLRISKQITNRDSPSLDRYLVEIGKVDLITADQEVVLAQRIREGDTVALQKMVNANLRFVVSVAKQYQNRGLPLNDLINEGNFGLVKAAMRFDEKRGFKFISYAVWWIRQSMLQAVADQSRVVRMPLNRVGILNRVNTASSSLEQRLEREPSAEELSEVLDITSDEITETLLMSGKQMSITAPLGEDSTLLDVLPNDSEETPDAMLINDSLNLEIQRSLATLTDREADVIKLHFGLNGESPMTLDEISEKFELTRERVRQIKESGIRRLRQTSRSKLLRHYLG